MEQLNLKDFEGAMTEEFSRGLRVLVLAMAFAPLVYLVVGFLYCLSAPVPAVPPDNVFVGLLTLIGLAELAGATWLADRSLLKQDMAKVFERGIKRKDGTYIRERSEIVGGLLRAHCLLRLALVDSVAIYGLLVSFMAGALVFTEPLWQLAFAPCALATGIILLNYPTKERLRLVFERTLQGRP